MCASIPALQEDPLEMSLNETDKAWIRQAIHDAQKTSGAGKLAKLVKEWSGTGAAIATIIFLATQWSGYIEFRTHTNDRLDHIESGLRTLQALQVPHKVLYEIASLPASQLAKNLPALQTVSEQPLEKVSPTPEVLKSVAVKLSAVDNNTTGYWPTVLAFIRFASASMANNAPAPGTPVGIILFTSNRVPTQPGIVYELHGAIANVTFVNDRILLTNDPVVFRNVRFVNCAFDLPNSDSPPKYLRQMGQQLLASDISSGTLNTGM